eukprot:12810960-Heterocapsa_arctica.AAC.1
MNAEDAHAPQDVVLNDPCKHLLGLSEELLHLVALVPVLRLGHVELLAQAVELAGHFLEGVVGVDHNV